MSCFCLYLQIQKSTSEIFLSGKISTNAFGGFSICGKQDYCILWAIATDFKRQEKKQRPTNQQHHRLFNLWNRIGFSTSDKDKYKPWYIRVPPIKSVFIKIILTEVEKYWVHWHKKSPLQSIGRKQNTALTHQEHITGKAKACWHECIKSMFV